MRPCPSLRWTEAAADWQAQRDAPAQPLPFAPDLALQAFSGGAHHTFCGLLQKFPRDLTLGNP